MLPIWTKLKSKRYKSIAGKGENAVYMYFLFSNSISKCLLIFSSVPSFRLFDLVTTIHAFTGPEKEAFRKHWWWWGGKGENPDSQHFLLFPQFSILSNLNLNTSPTSFNL